MTLKWILLRGLTRGQGHWGDFPNLLQKKGVEIEFLEIPGNGTLHKLKTPTEVLEVISYLRSSSRFVSSSESFNILGLSLGGMLALKWAEFYPEKIGTVAVVNSSLKQYSNFYERLSPQLYMKLLRALFEKDVRVSERHILEMVSNNPNIVEKYLNYFLEFSDKNPVSKENFIRQLILASKVEIKFPIKADLKIISSAADRLVNPICTHRIAEKAGVDPIIHPSAGHDIPLDEPHWLIEVLLGRC